MLYTIDIIIGCAVGPIETIIIREVLELLQLLLDLLRGPLQARQHVLTRVEVIASTEVNGNVWTADRGASGGLEKK